MPITFRVEGASRGAFEIRTPRDAISVSILQETLHNAVHIYSSYQDRAPRRTWEMKIVWILLKEVNRIKLYHSMCLILCVRESCL